jgi:tripartite-type tricarboxylate transporter receptor subunit TctC
MQFRVTPPSSRTGSTPQVEAMRAECYPPSRLGNMLQSFRQWATGLAVSLAALTVQAQDFPSKAISLVVPYPAGGAMDFVARLVQPEYQRRMGQQVLVENIGGVGGALGLQRVLAAPADGHTQALGSPTELVLTPMALPAVKFKPADWRLAALVARTPLFLLIRSDLPVTSLDELIHWARGREPSYGTVGVGSLSHVMSERFATQSGLKMIHVPYKGGSTLIAELAGGQLDMAFFALAGPVPAMVKQGRIKVLGISQQTPSSLFPDVPPLSRHPLLQGFHFDTWIGLQVPRGTPDAAVAKINQSMREVIMSEPVRRQIEASGAHPAQPMSLTELDRFYAADVERYQAAARSIRWPQQ